MYAFALAAAQSGCGALSAPRRRHSMSGRLPSRGGCRLPPVRKNSRSWNAARPVGIGEKVLVSVARVAMNSFMGIPGGGARVGA